MPRDSAWATTEGDGTLWMPSEATVADAQKYSKRGRQAVSTFRPRSLVAAGDPTMLAPRLGMRNPESPIACNSFAIGDLYHSHTLKITYSPIVRSTMISSFFPEGTSVQWHWNGCPDWKIMFGSHVHSVSAPAPTRNAAPGA